MSTAQQRGRIKSWNDDKGFGFIQPLQGEQVFVHISVMHGERRPAVGDAVLYVAGTDERGRLRAEHVRLDGELQLDQPSIRVKPAARTEASRKKAPQRERERPAGPVRSLKFKLVVLACLCALPGFGALQMLLRGESAVPLGAYVLVSLLTFFLYWSDKNKAQSGSWRTPENVLHASELLGGWPGALLGQQVFRHKTRKLSYQLVFWVIVLVHQVFWVDRLLLGSQMIGKVLIRGF